jgi:hypothetical protein
MMSRVTVSSDGLIQYTLCDSPFKNQGLQCDASHGKSCLLISEVAVVSEDGV